MHDGTFVIELFPEDAPNTVNNFLKLVERGYYDGIVFHRIIPGFMIQGGDPNTKDPEADRSLWGQGGPGFQITEEFNTLQHDRGIVSMARSTGINTAGSQFFIMHNDANILDGEYTAFGRLVPGTFSDRQLDNVATLATDDRDAPLDVLRATIIEATIIDPYTPPPGFTEPDRNTSIVKKIGQGYSAKSGGENYSNYIHQVSFDLPYRWAVVGEGTGDYLNLVVEPTTEEHNVQEAIKQSGFTPQISISAEKIDSISESTGVSSAFFLIKGGDEPKVLSNYIFENDNGVKAHVVITTQNLQAQTETVQFKTIQLHFLSPELSYSIIYVNLTEWFRYEINAFATTVSNFKIMSDGKMQPVDFGQNPVFRQLITDSKEKPEPESLPPARIGGCLIATAAFGSEMAPQVQFLREIRDNTVLQTESGSAFMAGFNQFYYSFSPTIADYERENPAFKEAVKLTLTPLLTSLTLLQYADIDSESEMLGYGIGIILLNVGIYFVAPVILITKIRSFYKLQ
jgi:peptidyl-prolyl cis-trans isomerase B (cyclophilin B)